MVDSLASPLPPAAFPHLAMPIHGRHASGKARKSLHLTSVGWHATRDQLRHTCQGPTSCSLLKSFPCGSACRSGPGRKAAPCIFSRLETRTACMHAERPSASRIPMGRLPEPRLRIVGNAASNKEIRRPTCSTPKSTLYSSSPMSKPGLHLGSCCSFLSPPATEVMYHHGSSGGTPSDNQARVEFV
jgi:hypothetical protein